MNTYFPDNRTVGVAAPASTAIAVGDLLYWDSSAKQVKPASSQTDAGTLIKNQRTFAALFAGISQNQRLASQSTAGNITVIQDGVFTFSCAATSWDFGDLIGAVENGAGDALVNQTVAKVTSPALAIGVCVEGTASGATKVKGYFSSRIAFSLSSREYNGVAEEQGVSSTALADADTTLTLDANPYLRMTPTSNPRKLILPTEALSRGFHYWINNLAAMTNGIQVRDSGDANTIITIPATKAGIVWCDGTTWRGIVGA